jgi:predicted transcriptional regulator
MSRSKLQVNLDILKALADNGKFNSTHIAYHTYINHKSVNECLEFLMKNNLITEIGCHSRKEYQITNLGIKTLQIAKKIYKELKAFN